MGVAVSIPLSEESGTTVQEVRYTFHDGSNRVATVPHTDPIFHTFPGPGTYAVTATVATTTGLVESVTGRISIPHHGPTAAIGHSVDISQLPEIVTASATPSTPGSSPITSYRWELLPSTANQTNPWTAEVRPHDQSFDWDGEEEEGGTPPDPQLDKEHFRFEVLDPPIVDGRAWYVRLTVTDQNGLSDTTTALVPPDGNPALGALDITEGTVFGANTDQDVQVTQRISLGKDTYPGDLYTIEWQPLKEGAPGGSVATNQTQPLLTFAQPGYYDVTVSAARQGVPDGYPSQTRFHTERVMVGVAPQIKIPYWLARANLPTGHGETEVARGAANFDREVTTFNLATIAEERWIITNAIGMIETFDAEGNRGMTTEEKFVAAVKLITVHYLEKASPHEDVLAHASMIIPSIDYQSAEDAGWEQFFPEEPPINVDTIPNAIVDGVLEEIEFAYDPVQATPKCNITAIVKDSYGLTTLKSIAVRLPADPDDLIDPEDFTEDDYIIA